MTHSSILYWYLLSYPERWEVSYGLFRPSALRKISVNLGTRKRAVVVCYTRSCHYAMSSFYKWPRQNINVWQKGIYLHHDKEKLNFHCVSLVTYAKKFLLLFLDKIIKWKGVYCHVIILLHYTTKCTQF